MGLLSGVNNNPIHLPNCLRGDRDVEGVQDFFYGYGRALDFFVQYQCISKLNSQHFVLETAFDLVDVLHLFVREDQVNRIKRRLT